MPKVLIANAAATVMNISSGVADAGISSASWAARIARMGVVAAFGKAIVPGCELVSAMAAVSTKPLNNAKPIPKETNWANLPENIVAPYEMVLLTATIPARAPAKSVISDCWRNPRVLGWGLSVIAVMKFA